MGATSSTPCDSHFLTEGENRQLKWDQRFMAMADLVAGWSKDPSRKVGAVIVDPNMRIVSVGYNGFPPGVKDTPERLNERETKYAIVKHAEDNAIFFAGRDLHNCTMYSTLYPCSQCAGAIIRAGIKKVVTAPAMIDDRFAKSFQLSKEMFSEARVSITEM